MNQAFEDAVELAQAIQQGGLTQDSLRAFEAGRIPRLQEVMAAEMVSFFRPAHCKQVLQPLKCFALNDNRRDLRETAAVKSFE